MLDMKTVSAAANLRKAIETATDASKRLTLTNTLSLVLNESARNHPAVVGAVNKWCS